MSIYSIYKATNIINGKIYIGFTSRWPERKDEHIGSANKKSNQLFHKAIKKYGSEAFIWEVICQSKNYNHLLLVMEPYFIKDYNSFYLNGQGYNMTLGGEGNVGYIHTEEHRKNNSLAKKGRPSSLKGCTFSEEHKHALKVSFNSKECKKKRSVANSGSNNPHYGKKTTHTPEGIEKMRAANLGKVATKETRERQSRAKKRMIICPHCQTEGSGPMYRWHFDNCSQKVTL